MRLSTLSIFLLFSPLLVRFCSANLENGTEEDAQEEFVGAEHWIAEHREMCDGEDSLWKLRGAVCLTYISHFQEVRMEVLSWKPALVIYRNLFTPKQVDDYLWLMEQKSFEEQQVIDDDGNSLSLKYRRANGTYLAENEHPISDGIMQTVRSSIPPIDFRASEHITAISYHPGGHYAVHNDFLSYTNEESWDDWMQEFGNRFATLIMVFKPADVGGATVFPQLAATLKPNAGDAFLWFNTNTDLEMEELTEHAGCPVYAGQKVISTIWIRMKHQEKYQPILENNLYAGSIHMKSLIPNKYI